MHVIGDADVIKYRVGYAAQKSYIQILDAGRPIKTVKNLTEAKKWIGDDPLDIDHYTLDPGVRPDDKASCLYSVKRQMEHIMDSVNGKSSTWYMSGPTNFRDAIATIRPYKGNRKKEKPFHYDNITEYLKEYWEVVIVDGIEGDDAMSIAQYTRLKGNVVDGYMEFYQDKRNRSCIATIDKDLDMVPGWHFNFLSDELYWCDFDPGHLYYETENVKVPKLYGSGLLFFYAQLIMGDSGDNIQGVPGSGPAEAIKLLKGVDREMIMYNVVKAAYDTAYTHEMLPRDMSADQALLENGRLLWMQTKEGELWSPPISQKKQT